MNKTLRIFPLVVVALLVFGWPESAFAQRGGHVGGAGFGGRGSLHGGGFYRGGTHFAPSARAVQGGFHGGVYTGWHGGFHGHSGWYGGWGWGGWGWGFGFGVGFGWPYWPVYPYPYNPYVYPPWWGGPYYYPYYAPRYPYPGNGNNGPPANSGPKSNNNSPSNHWRPPAGSSPDSMTTTLVALDSTAPVHPTDGTISNATNDRRAHAAMEQFPSRRREVQNAIRALREMPPYARKREIDNGHFSPEERDFLRSLDW